MAGTTIEWTEMTWNPTTGCTKISAGCKNCYAEKMTCRLQGMGMNKYKDGFNVRWHESELKVPYTWSKPRMIFVNSMSDLFHEEISLAFIKRVFRVMNECSKHTFQVLTKRADILAQYSPMLNWTPNIWMGVTVECDRVVDRIDYLRETSAFLKFLSLEPLLTDLPALNLNEIDWVIVGGESGPCARIMNEQWVISIRNQCALSGIPFFFKQWGGKNKKANGSLLNGNSYKQVPIIRTTVMSH
ncbi:MAG: phage Gp37/Gp68 family protein [Bacteroidetes bacterium]|nr:phage Gp37/Gp68 family protein [Bacteroidota bacterium]